MLVSISGQFYTWARLSVEQFYIFRYDDLIDLNTTLKSSNYLIHKRTKINGPRRNFRKFAPYASHPHAYLGEVTAETDNMESVIVII